jgi:FlgD Ig-like domain
VKTSIGMHSRRIILWILCAGVSLLASNSHAGWQWTSPFGGTSPDVELRVSAMAEYRGSLYVAGLPLEIVREGQPFDVLVRRSAQGDWESVLTRSGILLPATQDIQEVRCLLSTPTGLVIGGTFDALGDSLGFSNVAVYDQGSWRRLGRGIPRAPWVLAEHRGELYAGTYGRGTSAPVLPWATPTDSTRASLWRFDGVDWSPIPPIPGTRMSVIRTLLSRPEGLWAGGSFSADGGPVGAALFENGGWTLPGGGLQSTLPPTRPFPLHVLQGVAALQEFGGEVFASGSFRNANVQTVARYDAGTWTDMGVDGSVEVLHLHRGAMVAVGDASFPAAYGPRREGISRWDGSAWRPEFGVERVAPELGAIRSAVSLGDTLVLGGVQRGGLGFADNPRALLRNDGNGWQDFLNPDRSGSINFMGQVTALEVVGDSLLVGGRFLGAGGTPVRNVARWGDNGWTGVGQGLMRSAPCPSWSTVVDLFRDQGVQYAAGSFLAFDALTGDIAPCNVARQVGDTWIATQDGLAPADSTGRPAVKHLLSWRRRLLAVGDFRTLDQPGQGGIAELINRVWQSTMPALSSAQLDSQQSISDAVVFENDLVVAGNFDGIAGISTGGIARFDGTSWKSVLAVPETFGRVDLQVHEGALYLAGRRSADPLGPTLYRIDGGALVALGSGSIEPFSILLSTPRGLFGIGLDLVRIDGDTVTAFNVTPWPSSFLIGTMSYSLASAVYRPAQQEIVISGAFQSSAPYWSNGLAILRADAIVPVATVPSLRAERRDGVVRVEWSWPPTWRADGYVQRARLERRELDRGWSSLANFLPDQFRDLAVQWEDTRPVSSRSAEYRLVAETADGEIAGESFFLAPVSTALRSQWLGSRPNPFNPSTSLEFTLQADGFVSVRVYSLDGRLVRVLADEWRSAGLHELSWDGRDEQGRGVASGAYVVRLDTPDARDQIKVLLAK